MSKKYSILFSALIVWGAFSAESHAMLSEADVDGQQDLDDQYSRVLKNLEMRLSKVLKSVEDQKFKVALRKSEECQRRCHEYLLRMQALSPSERHRVEMNHAFAAAQGRPVGDPWRDKFLRAGLWDEELPLRDRIFMVRELAKEDKARNEWLVSLVKGERLKFKDRLLAAEALPLGYGIRPQYLRRWARDEKLNVRNRRLAANALKDGPEKDDLLLSLKAGG